MKPTVFIQTNSRQIVGALVAEHSLRRSSLQPDAFDVRVTRTGAGRKHNYQCFSELFVLLDAPSRLYAIHVRHEMIEQNDVERRPTLARFGHQS